MYAIGVAWINYVQVRVEAASTIATMLEGQALVLTQVAEYKESSKRGSFTTLSCSLGQILMQLHTGMRVTNISDSTVAYKLWLFPITITNTTTNNLLTYLSYP
jgi:hypothetical protein